MCCSTLSFVRVISKGAEEESENIIHKGFHDENLEFTQATLFEDKMLIN